MLLKGAPSAARFASLSAYDRWIDDTGGSELPALVQETLNELRRAIRAA